MDQTLDTGLKHSVVPQSVIVGAERKAGGQQSNTFSIGHARKSGPVIVAIDSVYLLVAVILASAVTAMLAVAAPLALAFGAFGGLVVGHKAPKAWRPVSIR